MYTSKAEGCTTRVLADKRSSVTACSGRTSRPPPRPLPTGRRTICPCSVRSCLHGPQRCVEVRVPIPIYPEKIYPYTSQPRQIVPLDFIPSPERMGQSETSKSGRGWVSVFLVKLRQVYGPVSVGSVALTIAQNSGSAFHALSRTRSNLP